MPPAQFLQPSGVREAKLKAETRSAGTWSIDNNIFLLFLSWRPEIWAVIHTIFTDGFGAPPKATPPEGPLEIVPLFFLFSFFINEIFIDRFRYVQNCKRVPRCLACAGEDYLIAAYEIE